ncbi:MAG: hypothetical protein IPJ43_02625 [Saprospiraceae bacterium]|nr:hypothetical protein [Saprospiraceae bacterium]
MPPAIAKDTKVAELAINANQGVFELMHDVELNSKHNEMLFYTFGEKNCCLPKGATFAILKGDYSTLKKHDFLVLTEVKGPSTGLKEDADVIKRHVVRLENIDVFEDFDFKKNDNTTIEITKITWHVEDALPFPLCISSSNKDEEFNDVSIALGNIVLCDYGLTIIDNEFKDSSIQPSVVPASIGNYSNKDGSHCSEVKPKMIPIRYRPTLTKSPLTFSESIVVKNPDKKNEVFSAKRLLFQEASNALPALELTDTIDSKWEAQMDLLIDSTPSSKHFITEVESNGIVSLRFGDDINGARPNAGIQFKAKYRIGNGIAGNIGSDTIYHIIAPQSVVAALTALGNDGKDYSIHFQVMVVKIQKLLKK